MRSQARVVEATTFSHASTNTNTPTHHKYPDSLSAYPRSNTNDTTTHATLNPAQTRTSLLPSKNTWPLIYTLQQRNLNPQPHPLWHIHLSRTPYNTLTRARAHPCCQPWPPPSKTAPPNSAPSSHKPKRRSRASAKPAPKPNRFSKMAPRHRPRASSALNSRATPQLSAAESQQQWANCSV